jgi:hypothetical protein
MMGKLSLACLAPDVAAAQWRTLLPMIDEGFAVGGEIIPADFMQRIEGGEVLIWVAVDDETAVVHAVMTTELVRMRSGLVCWMGQCAGDRMREWRDFHTKIEDYARGEGCVKTILKGRFGWERALEGYRVRTVTLEKVL